MPSFPEAIALIPALYLVAVAWPLTVIDLREHRLPNRLVLPVFPIALLSQLIATMVTGDWARQVFAVTASVSVMAIGILINYFDVLGMGDVKLAAAISLVVAYFNLYLPVIAIGIAFVLAFGGVLFLIFKGKAKLGSSIPLGPYLLLSFIGSMVVELTTNLV